MVFACGASNMHGQLIDEPSAAGGGGKSKKRKG
jgi:hypothetical protein